VGALCVQDMAHAAHASGMPAVCSLTDARGHRAICEPCLSSLPSTTHITYDIRKQVRK
jgi:hypothetical protein